MLKSNEENRYLMTRVGKTYHIEDRKNLLINVLRKNSIMKKDTAYLTYTSTALFGPINTLRLLTIEDPKVSQACNMVELIKQGVEESKQWLREIFTEGIVMAAVGNYRDKGYLASLRKMFITITNFIFFKN